MKIINIVVLLLCIAVIYILFFKKEKMTADANTKKLIQDHYKIDVDAIRNLSKLANDLTKNGKLRVPGGLEVDGAVNIKGLTTIKNELQIHSKDKGVTHFNHENKGEHHINGITNLNNDIRMNGTSTFNGPTNFKNQKTGKFTHLNHPDGHIFLRGNVHIDGFGNSGKDLHVNGVTHLKNELNIHNGNNKGMTHFNHQNKGTNYIRGEYLNIDNNLNVNSVSTFNGLTNFVGVKHINFKGTSWGPDRQWYENWGIGTKYIRPFFTSFLKNKPVGTSVYGQIINNPHHHGNLMILRGIKSGHTHITVEMISNSINWGINGVFTYSY